MLRMGDAVSVGNLPDGLDGYAGYANGLYANTAEMKRRWPNKPIVEISVWLANIGNCLDIERFDATPDQAGSYVLMRRAAGVGRPKLYASISVMPSVEADCASKRIDRANYMLWSAHYTNQPHICGPWTCDYMGGGRTPQCDATQWTDHNNLWDETLAMDDFFVETGVDRVVSKSNAIPAGEKVLTVEAGWAGPNRLDPTNELDVYMTTDLGNVYHKWFVPTIGWNGPELINGVL